MSGLFRALMPYRSFVLVTRLGPNEVRAAIERIVRPPRGPSRAKDDRPYHGMVDREGFTILRRIRYRSTFFPIVRGRIEQSREGTRVHVNMRLHVAVAVFLALWLFAALLAAVLSTVAALRGATSSPLGTWVLPGFVGVLTAVAFGAEANQTTSILRLLLNAEERDEI